MMYGGDTHLMQQSPPIRVLMAGFESDTFKLFAAGWQISVEKFHAFRDYGQERFQMAFRHDGLGQMMWGHLHLNRGDLFFSHKPQSWDGSYVQIEHMAPQLHFQNVSPHHSFGRMPEFQAIDPRPDFLQVKTQDLATFAMFKPVKADPDFELYIHEKDEKEIMEILLAKQDPRQKEIRQNQKRRAYLDKTSGQHNPTHDISVKTDVSHQIILVS